MSKSKLIIYGNGSMARVYSMYLKDDFEIVAYTVSSSLASEKTFNNKPLIPFEELSKQYPADDYKLIIAVGYVGMNNLRYQIALQAQEMGYILVSYVSDTIKLDDNFTLGNNSLVLDHGSIHSGTTIGNNVFISSGVHIGHDCKIGNNVWINSGVTIGGGTEIGDNCFLGMNATISHGISIKNKAFIGAATLVSKSVSTSQVVISQASETISMSSETFLKFSRRM